MAFFAVLPNGTVRSFRSSRQVIKPMFILMSSSFNPISSDTRMPVAYNMGKGFVPVRKAGKLPAETISKEYELEYGKATIEIHKDAIKPGQKVVIVDDLMATGGTAKAIMEMVEEMGAEVVASAFLIELDFLNGRKALPDCRVEAVIHYE